MATGKRDAEATRLRLLSAGATEFARYGIAGARVDRIAAAAKSNRAQIYHYFDSKEGLLNAVFERLVARVLSEAPMDAHDLPGYAGLLFDGYEADPEVIRLTTWYRLERGSADDLIASIVASNKAKVDAIAEAQRDGSVSTKFSPEVVLVLVIHTAALWASLTAEYKHLTASLSTTKRREVVTSVVASITNP